MNKHEVIIKDIIDDLLKIRQRRYDEYIDKLIIHSWEVDYLKNELYSSYTHENFIASQEDASEIWNDFVTDFDLPLIKLNKLLDKEQQSEAVLKIEKNMAKLHGKKYLSVKEFEEKYNMSKSSQQQYRSRLYNPLPYHQKVLGGKIVYSVDEVEKWLENQYK
ncbi:hypothetical protein [Sulfurimonas sp.]|uniref:hypothetical protein n=1 Tax=Sulfurimonas sp. TaxID=2022749 RepID=UPI0025ED9FA2|nr:hypothetical protein [Sulfurimonas sp.]